MILVDSNVLIFAYNQAAPEHKAARQWLAEILAGPTPVFFSWIALMAFVRVSTNEKLFVKPYKTDEAFEVIENWLSAPGSQIVGPGGEHRPIVKRLARESGVKGADLTDAHIAAIAIEHGLTLATTDSDFAQFKGLKVTNPVSR